MSFRKTGGTAGGSVMSSVHEVRFRSLSKVHGARRIGETISSEDRRSTEIGARVLRRCRRWV